MKSEKIRFSDGRIDFGQLLAVKKPYRLCVAYTPPLEKMFYFSQWVFLFPWRKLNWAEKFSQQFFVNFFQGESGLRYIQGR